MVYLAGKTGKTGTERDYLVLNGLPEFRWNNMHFQIQGNWVSLYKTDDLIQACFAS